MERLIRSIVEEKLSELHTIGEMKFLWICSLQTPVDVKISIVE